MIRSLGIDLSARRGLDLALLDADTLSALVHLPDAVSALNWIASLQPAPSVIGIDAPQAPRLALMTDADSRAALDPPPPSDRYQRYRVCDYQLARRGIGLYLSPAADEAVPNWMAVGFELFSALRARGMHLPATVHDTSASLLEVYPFAAFVTLLGCVPPPKSTPEGLRIRQALLVEQGLIGLLPALGHDALDAVAAALSATRYATGSGCAVGDPLEGMIALPIPATELLGRYRRQRKG